MSVELPPDLTLEAAVLMAIEAGLGSVWTALPGRVVSWDSSTQRATVQPTVGDVDPPRVLPPVVAPVGFPRAGGYLLALPIEAGDTGLLVFSSLSMAGWLRSGNEGSPLDTRRHSLSSAVFFPGIGPGSIANYPTSGATLGSESNLTRLHPVALGDRLQTLVNLLDSVIRLSTPPPATEPAFLALKTAWVEQYPTFAPNVESSDVSVTTDPELP